MCIACEVKVPPCRALRDVTRITAMHRTVTYVLSSVSSFRMRTLVFILFYFLFSPNEQRARGGGRRCQTFFFPFFFFPVQQTTV